MTAPHTFDATLELLPWGRNVYTVLKVPHGLADAARRAGTRRVDGTIDGAPVNLGLNRADVVPETFVYVGVSLRRRLDARAGDVVRCVLSPADPDLVPVADDVREALQRGGAWDAFAARSPADRRRLLAQVEDAASPSTRARRIDGLVRSL